MKIVNEHLYDLSDLNNGVIYRIVLKPSYARENNILDIKLLVGYIGKTTVHRLYTRLGDHASGSKARSGTTNLCTAIKEYGAENFELYILDVVSDGVSAYEAEKYYISLYNNVEIGMNETRGQSYSGEVTVHNHEAVRCIIKETNEEIIADSTSEMSYILKNKYGIKIHDVTIRTVLQGYRKDNWHKNEERLMLSYPTHEIYRKDVNKTLKFTFVDACMQAKVDSYISENYTKFTLPNKTTAKEVQISDYDTGLILGVYPSQTKAEKTWGIKLGYISQFLKGKYPYLMTTHASHKRVIAKRI